MPTGTAGQERLFRLKPGRTDRCWLTCPRWECRYSPLPMSTIIRFSTAWRQQRPGQTGSNIAGNCSQEFKLPSIGEGVNEADIAEILVSAGDTVEPGQIVMELETDKAVIELPIDAGGTIEEILVSQGQTVPVGAPLILLASAEAKAAAPSDAPAPAAAAPEATPAPAESAPAESAPAKPAPAKPAPAAAPAARRSICRPWAKG